MLNKTGEDGHPGLDPDVKGTYFSFSQLSIMLAVDLSHTVFIIFNYVSSLPTLLVFIKKWVL